MIISDLNYMETVDTSEVQGGSSKKPVAPEPPAKKYYSISIADADADAIAVGKISIALTNTFAVAVPGGAYPSVSSTAISIGH